MAGGRLGSRASSIGNGGAGMAGGRLGSRDSSIGNSGAGMAGGRLGSRGSLFLSGNGCQLFREKAAQHIIVGGLQPLPGQAGFRADLGSQGFRSLCNAPGAESMSFISTILYFFSDLPQISPRQEFLHLAFRHAYLLEKPLFRHMLIYLFIYNPGFFHFPSPDILFVI